MPRLRRFFSALMVVALVSQATPAVAATNYYNAISYTSPTQGLIGGLANGMDGVAYRTGGGIALVASATVGELQVMGLDATGTSAWAVLLNTEQPVYSPDGGITWAPKGRLQYSGYEAWPNDVKILSGGRVAVVGQSKTVSDPSGDPRGDLAFINTSDDGGTTWVKSYEEPMETGYVGEFSVLARSTFRDIDESPDGSLAIAVGTKYGDNYVTATKTMSSRSIDGGATWSSTTTLPPNGVTYFDASAVAVSDSHVAYAFAGNQYWWWKTTDGGLTWAIQPKITGMSYFHANGADSCDASTAVVVGAGGSSYNYGLIAYTKDGSTWTKPVLPNGTSTPVLRDVQMVTNTLWIAVGDNNTMLVTRNAGVNWEVAPNPPTISVAGIADGGSYLTTVTPTITLTNAATQTVTLDNNLFVSGTPVSTDGTHTLNVTAANAWGVSTARSYTFNLLVDRTPPTIQVTGVTNGETYGHAVAPVVDIAGQTTQTITMDGSPFVSGTSVSADGSHTLDVTALDAAGNVAAKRVGFKIDKVAPVITISGVADGGSYATSVTPVIGITDQSAKNSTITLDGAAFSSGTRVSVEGSHTLRVQASDVVGNASSQTVSFLIDTIPPSITVTGVADGAAYVTTVTPVVTITGQNMQTVTLDGAPFASGAPVSADGTHSLDVWAQDLVGNTSRKTVTFGVAIDRTPPAIGISGVADGVSYATTVTPLITVTGQTSQTVTLDGASFLSGTPVSVEGSHTLHVLAEDAVGNLSSAIVNFLIDSTPPVVTVTGVENGASYATTVSPTVTITGQAVDSVTLDGSAFVPGTKVSAEGIHTLDVFATDAVGNISSRHIAFIIDTTPPVIDVSGVSGGASYATTVTPLITVTGQTSQTVTLDGLAFASGTPVSVEGSHTLRVRAQDAVGNAASSTIDFLIDTTPPLITVTGVQDGANYARFVAPTVTISGHTMGSVTLDGSVFVPGTKVSAEGIHTIEVFATDAVGNTSSRHIAFIIDTTPPVIDVSGVTDGASYATTVTPLVAVSAQSTQTVTLDGATFASGTPFSVEGSHTLQVTASDLAGNASSQTVNFLIDTTPPVITVTGVESGAAYVTTVTPVITVTGHATRTITLDGIPFDSGTKITAEGTHSIQVAAEDAVGNYAERIVTFGISVPVVTVRSSSATLTAYGRSWLVTGTLECAGQPVAGKRVQLQTGTATSTIAPVAIYATTTAAGAFAFAVKPSSTTYYRIRFAGDASMLGSLPSNEVRVMPAAYVGTPVAPSTMSRSRYYTVSGTLKPRHTSGTYPVRIYKYRYVSGKWKSYGYTTAKASNSYSYSKYARSIRLPYTGRWRLRAYHADSGHAASWSSGYDTVTVR